MTVWMSGRRLLPDSNVGETSRPAFHSLVILLAFGAGAPCYGEQDAEHATVDATTLHQHAGTRRTPSGRYQGWFRCPGDGTGEGWLHWSRDLNKLTPDSVTVEMWPDMTEYSESERSSCSRLEWLR
jgi:hypothetical protein